MAWQVAEALRRHPLRVDGDGNVYVALAGEGRVVVLNPKGAPIGRY